MKFDTSTPTEPGAYWWQETIDSKPRLAEVWQEGHLYAKSEGQDALVDEIGGLWCQLVTLEAMQDAYGKGFRDGMEWQKTAR